jgi:hypothetical protein
MIEAGDIVQVNPEKHAWGPVLVVVTEVFAWGVQGYAHVPASRVLNCRFKWAEINETGGRVAWERADKDEVA